MNIPREQFQEYLAGWRRARQKMEELRRADPQDVDVAWAMQMLADAFESARRHYPPEPTSGLIEQQKWFMKGRK